MAVRIIEVENRRDLRRWVRFPLEHFTERSCFVPPLINDEMAYFDPRKNPAYEVCQSRLFLALRNDRPVGRICAIINSLEETKLGYKRGRFGWFDSIDDQEVATALFDVVRAWHVSEGCTEMTGPHGFNDLDMEGLLIEGFDELPTIAGNFSYPYYRTLVEQYGFTKDVDYIESRTEVPRSVPFLESMRKRYASNKDYYVLGCKTKKELLGHVNNMWELLEVAFEPLYGVVPLTAAQTKYYTRKYFGFLDPEFVKFAYSSDGRMDAFLAAMPSLSHAFVKARGRLFPTGFLHILKAFRKPAMVDFLLGAARPDVRSAAPRAMIWVEMHDSLVKRGVRFIETNHQLEDNTEAHVFTRYPAVYRRRARVFRLGLDQPPRSA